MISVIKNGKEKNFYTRCNKCGSEMEYNHDDVKYETSVASTGITRRFIICPVCGETLLVNLVTKEEFDEMKKGSNSWMYNSCAGI